MCPSLPDTKTPIRFSFPTLVGVVVLAQKLAVCLYRFSAVMPGDNKIRFQFRQLIFFFPGVPIDLLFAVRAFMLLRLVYPGFYIVIKLTNASLEYPRSIMIFGMHRWTICPDADESRAVLRTHESERPAGTL